ncbi:hypothetical protein ASD76_03830 [Altererythrobacter sp. Root672]|nr:hypothetical protein ASD76_03830 [Altererythrobacter sp. Root672]
MVCALAILHLRAEDLVRYRTIAALIAATFLLILAHLLPLPPAVWQMLPHRDLIVEIDGATGLADVWRPLTIAPQRTWNALFSLFVPLSVFLLLARFDRGQLRALLLPVICIGLLSGFVGLLQITGGEGSPLYFYSIHNDRAAVGLFSNRNHQAMLLASLFPMLAVYASLQVRTTQRFRLRAMVCAAAGAVLVPLLLVTGSRAGLVLGLIGLASVPFLFRRPATDDPQRRKAAAFPIVPVVLGIAGVTLVALLALLFSRAEALTRITGSEQAEDLRFQAFMPMLDMAWRYFPFGSGLGSFVEAYQRDEPASLLKPEYFNHAHNDFMEIALTGGVLALLLLAVAIAAWLIAGLRVWRPFKTGSDDTRIARMGFVIIGQFLLASTVDYPVRTPSLACLLILAAVWLKSGIRQSEAEVSNRLEVPQAFR